VVVRSYWRWQEEYLGWQSILLEHSVILPIVCWIGVRGEEGGVVGARPLVLVATLQ